MAKGNVKIVYFKLIQTQFWFKFVDAIFRKFSMPMVLQSTHDFIHMCEHEREKERERVCVCLCVSVFVCVCVCVCVCVIKRWEWIWSGQDGKKCLDSNSLPFIRDTSKVKVGHNKMCVCVSEREMESNLRFTI